MPALGLLSGLCAGPAWADDAAEPGGTGIRFNGFGTVGLVRARNSEDWEFVRDKAQPPEDGHVKTRVDTRVGLQANWQPSPRWEGVTQVVLKRMDPNAGAEQYVDWAFVAWRPTPEWTFRLGRTAPDIFLLVDYRNVGFAYPWVRPNSEFYGWITPDASDGMDAAYAWMDGSAQWRVKLSYGESRSALVDAGGDGGLMMRNKGLFTSTLSREDDGLLLKASYSRTRSSLTGMPLLQSLDQGLAALQALPVPNVAQEATVLRDNVLFTDRFSDYFALGVSYEKGPWWLHAEVNQLGGDLVSANGRRAYASVAYRLGRVTGYTAWGRALPVGAPIAATSDWAATLAPLLGDAMAQQATMLGAAAGQVANASRIDQRTNSLGLRWDFDARMALKLQWDHCRIHPDGSGLWQRATPAAARADVLSATLDFLF
ncbi:MAG TPA: hypothetical protein VFL86_21190 [Burkholderiaceae bacterium]|nr:hypothetical protein [Burkholderiaceae bacterium]